MLFVRMGAVRSGVVGKRATTIEGRGLVVVSQASHFTANCQLPTARGSEMRE